MIKESKLIGTQVPMPYGWREFKVGDLFDVLLSAGDNKISDLPKGEIPLITSGASNNGIAGLVAFGEGQLFDKGVLTADMFGNVLFQPKAFYAVSHGRVNILKPVDDGATMQSLLFIASLIKKQTVGRYGFDYMLSSSRVHDLSIELPVAQDGQPDYGWMSSYIRELENQRIRELDTYLQVTGLDDITLTDNELQVLKQWRQHEKFGGGTLPTKRFKVGELFDVSRAHGFDKGHIVLSSHGTEFIGRTENNNGVQGFYADALVVPNEANTISISQIGAQTAQYRANPWYASQNLFKLMPTFVMNELHALFMIAVINKQLSVYSGYANFPTGKDIRNMNLELPVTPDDTPDYEFMETFIRAQEKLSISQLSDFRAKQIAETKALTRP